MSDHRQCIVQSGLLQEKHFSPRAILGSESTSGTSIFLIADGLVQIVMDAEAQDSNRSTDSGTFLDEDKTGELVLHVAWQLSAGRSVLEGELVPCDVQASFHDGCICRDHVCQIPVGDGCRHSPAQYTRQWKSCHRDSWPWRLCRYVHLHPGLLRSGFPKAVLSHGDLVLYLSRHWQRTNQLRY